MRKINFYILSVVCFLAFAAPFASIAQIISTIAGNGTQNYSGDGGAATAAELNFPTATAVDAGGNVYIADFDNNRIRAVNIFSGKISTFAGTGSSGFSGDGGPATSAELYLPIGVTVDSYGNLYIADFFNNRVRKVIRSTGKIITIAGNGTSGYSGDGGPATSAELNSPTGVTVDNLGNVYIADFYENRVRKVNAAGIISTFAGNGTAGFSGDGGPATSAELNSPSVVALDGSGNVYIADTHNNRIRIVNSAGTINTFAGNGTAGFSGDGGLATAAEMINPTGVAVDILGNVYIADLDNNRIREVYAGGSMFYTPGVIYQPGNIYTIAGTGSAGFSGDGGLSVSAKLNSPYGITVDASFNLYIPDYDNARIREIARPIPASPVVTTATTSGALSVNSALSLGNYTATTVINAGPGTNAVVDSGQFINLVINTTVIGNVAPIISPGQPVTLHASIGPAATLGPNIGTPTYTWSNGGTGANTTVSPTSTTNYTLTITPYEGNPFTEVIPVIVQTSNVPTSCDTCIGTINFTPGQTYLVSSWAKNHSPSDTNTIYTYPRISVSFTGGSGPTFGPFTFRPAGLIIDGWQRIEGQFTVPSAATGFNIVLGCNTGSCNFDDLRVFPFNGTLKTYVYDPGTLRLWAVLDERNYATLYEYDEEGKLIRVKKETERGIMTIQESRTSMQKKY